MACVAQFVDVSGRRLGTASGTSPDLAATFDLQPGQIELTNNRFVGYARSVFADEAVADRRCLMLRIWLRDCSGIGYFW